MPRCTRRLRSLGQGILEADIAGENPRETQSLFSTPLSERLKNKSNKRCNTIFRASRTIKLYLVSIKMNNSREYAILMVSPSPNSFVIGLIGHRISQAKGIDCTCISQGAWIQHYPSGLVLKSLTSFPPLKKTAPPVTSHSAALWNRRRKR